MTRLLFLFKPDGMGHKGKSVKPDRINIKTLLMDLPVALAGHLLNANSPEGVRLHTIDTA